MTPPEFWTGINMTRLAADLNLSRQAVYQWKNRAAGVPAERVLEVEKVVEKKREVIRPDLFA